MPLAAEMAVTFRPCDVTNVGARERPRSWSREIEKFILVVEGIV